MPKYYILTLVAKAPGVSALEPTSLESPFDADDKVWYTRNATKHSFCSIGDLVAVLGHENRPPCHVHAHGSAIPGLSPKIGENLSEMWLNCRAKFHTDRSSPG